MQTIKINDDNTLTIELSTGDRYTLREPLAKDMEGLGQDLIKVKHTDTVQKLLGKISTPPLTRVAYGKLSMSDAQVLNVAIDFFQRRRQPKPRWRQPCRIWATPKAQIPSRPRRANPKQRSRHLSGGGRRREKVLQLNQRLPRPMRGDIRQPRKV